MTPSTEGALSQLSPPSCLPWQVVGGSAAPVLAVAARSRTMPTDRRTGWGWRWWRTRGPRTMFQMKTWARLGIALGVLMTVTTGGLTAGQALADTTMQGP